MTNTKFRKRALLSSVAMLLVALVALGSATFAWFTSDPQAHASGIKMNTSTSTGLVAKAVTDTNGFSHYTGLNGGWDAALYKGDAFTLQPATLAFAANDLDDNYYTATATTDDNYAALASTIERHAFSTTLATAPQTSGVYAERIYLKTTGGDAATVTRAKVSYTTTTNSVADGVRITLLDKNGAHLGTWGPGHANHYVTDDGSDMDFTTGTTTYTKEATALKTGLSIAVNGSEDANWVTVLVWLDGEEENVKSTNVTNLAELLSTVQIDFSLDNSLT